MGPDCKPHICQGTVINDQGRSPRLCNGAPGPWSEIAMLCADSIILSTHFVLGTVQRTLWMWNLHSDPKRVAILRLREME